MTTTVKEKAVQAKRRAQLMQLPGVRSLARPLPDDGVFDLAYTRTGPTEGVPVLAFPGGPGMASVLPYQRLRARATRMGIRLIMVEHRGIGLSRVTGTGADLPRTAISLTDAIDDAVAVLDAEGIDRAVVYGTSYGSYLAQGFGVRHPDRVAGMILDSVMLGAHFGESSTAMLRNLFWNGTPTTAPQAAMVRRLAEEGALDPAQAGFPLQFLYEFGGLDAVDRALALLGGGRGRRFWKWILHLGADEVMRPKPFLMEFDLVGEIAFRELDFAPATDGGPLETAGSFTAAAEHFSRYEGEPFDLPEQVRAFTWPTIVISGDRDVRTPQATAEEAVSRIPGSVLLAVRDQGHSTFDTQPTLALDVVRGMTARLAADEGVTRAALPSDPRGRPGLMNRIVYARLALSRIAPRALS